MSFPPVNQLHSQANSLVDAEFQQEGGQDHINEAITLDREALELCPPGHSMRVDSLSQLSRHLQRRYRLLGDIKDIEEGIVLERAALELRPPGHPERNQSLTCLASRLSVRYTELRQITDLDEAISLSHDALVLFPPQHQGRPASLNSLACRLSTRYERLGMIEDLDEAITLDRTVLFLRPFGHVGRSKSLNNLAVDLHTRYKKLGSVEDLDEAIELDRESLDLRPPGHPDRSKSLNNLSADIHARYQKLGAIQDLNEAIALDRDALALRSSLHPGRPLSLSNLSVDLHTRYQKLGNIEDLDEAIFLGREALLLCPPGHPTSSMSLSNLSAHLHTRYRILGAIEDLDEAIALDRDALTLRPYGHPGHSTTLCNLSVDLHSRYQQLGAMEDLEEGIALQRDALALRPPGHPERPTSLSNLSAYLHARYQIFGVIGDLDEAIALDQDAMGLLLPGHPDFPTSLSNLSSHLLSRHRKLGTMDDLDQAIELNRDVLSLRPSGHPSHSTTLKNLAMGLFTRFQHSHESQDKAELFTLYTQLVEIPHTSSSDLFATRSWVDVAEYFRHPTTLPAYETALRLLTHHISTLPSLPRNLKLVESLASSLAVDAFSACLRNSSPTKAVELLEQGRGVFLSQLARLRSPVEEVIASGLEEAKKLADEFLRLTSLIRKALDSQDADQHDRVCRLNVKLRSVISDIRKLPGLSHFLLPPPFSELQKAAIGGPVIIVNASQYGCDALIVLAERDPVHVPLQITRDRIRDMASDLYRLTIQAKSTNVDKYLAVILRELWETVVSPIVDTLRATHPPQSRIWWCATAEFSLLPLHAAGTYSKAYWRRLSDLYISSYTTTLASLVHARRHEPNGYASERKRFVAIGQAKAAGETELHAVDAEVAHIKGCMDDSLVTFTHMEGSASCIPQVVEALEQNEWVHFACHGLPNRDEPFESAFGLYDGRLTIGRIVQCELEHAEFSYLSACHTTVGDKACPDEMIHIASAMQFAGFRSVIGTMWAVDDEQTTKMTSRFYEKIKDESGHLDHTRAAFALHKTMKELEGRMTFDQRILYIHLGA